VENSPASPSLSVVVPAYNEQQRLAQTLAKIYVYLDRQPWSSEVIIADDGSEDDTATIVEQLAVHHPTLHLLRLDHRGKGFAVRVGALAACGHNVLLCDADLAVPLEDWDRLRDFLDSGYDIAIGSREGLGARREGEPWYRHLMGRVFNLIVRTVAVSGIRDTQCGFKALRREVARDLFAQVRIYGAHAPRVRGAAVTAYDVELLYLARRRGYQIAEVPVAWRYGTETKVSPLRDSWRNLRDVLRVRWYALRGMYRELDTPRPVGAVEEGVGRG
jgi:glycosyltransferase involved in cell wall biosynthesis